MSDFGSWLLLGIRWVHLIAATAWVGGGLFYLAAIQPALRRLRPEVAAGIGPAIGEGFRELAQTAIATLIVTGAVLTFDRLSGGADVVYAAVLALKVLLGVAMFGLAWELGWAGRRGKSSVRWPIAPANLLLIVGLVVFFLALLLRMLAPQ